MRALKSVDKFQELVLSWDALQVTQVIRLGDMACTFPLSAISLALISMLKMNLFFYFVSS